jgi:hypothetical protein
MGPQTNKHLLQSPFTCQFLLMATGSLFLGIYFSGEIDSAMEAILAGINSSCMKMSKWYVHPKSN